MTTLKLEVSSQHSRKLRRAMSSRRLEKKFCKWLSAQLGFEVLGIQKESKAAAQPEAAPQPPAPQPSYCPHCDGWDDNCRHNRREPPIRVAVIDY